MPIRVRPRFLARSSSQFFFSFLYSGTCPQVIAGLEQGWDVHWKMKRGIRCLQVNTAVGQLQLHIAVWVRQNSGFISRQENS